MKKIITVFLASSIVEFSTERMIIENFIRNISDKFEETYNIKIQPLLCENFDDAYTKARKQEEYNQKIRESDFCFFIFFTRVGEYTREEFEVAKEQFEKTNKPKIYTYFKIIEDGSADESLTTFMDELDKTFGHYYGTFSHIDTIKLRILLSLKLREMDFLEIKTDGRKCMVDNRPVMTLDNVSEFANNKQLNELLNELAEVEDEYYKLKPIYEKGGHDSAFYSHYSKIASRRRNLIDEAEELQKLIFNVSLRMIKDDIYGEITSRQKEAYRLFELGDYEGCMSVLNSEDIDSDFIRSRKRLHEQDLAVCKKYIREHKTAIDILSSMSNYAERFSEIEERYKKILPVIFETETELDTAKDYVSYLVDQNKDPEAQDVAEKLIKFSGDSEWQAYIANMLGIICSHLNQAEKAEEYYLRAIKLREALANENPQRFNPCLAMSYNNAGLFYDEQGQASKAEEYYLRAIVLYEVLADEDTQRFNPKLAGSYNNIGVFYANQGQASEAEGYCLKAIVLYEALADENPQRFNSDLAMSYNNIGVFYANQGQASKAEEYYLRAIVLYEVLVDENPQRFNPDLATSYNNIGAFYDGQGQAFEAEKYYLKAIKLREALADENSQRFNPGLATSYNNIGVFYKKQGKASEAGEYYLRAIKLREALADENPQRFNPRLAMSYYNYAICTNNTSMFQKALELAKTRPDDPVCRAIIENMA